MHINGKKSYNIDVLSDALQRDNAIIADKYEKVNKRTRIYFICNCGEEYDKLCLEIVSRAGAFCKICTKDNSINKLHKTRNAICTIETLNDIIQRDKAQLLIKYNTITKNTNIKFKCNCGEDSEKNCYQLILVSGAFCEACTRINWTNNIKRTNIERYNVECTAQAPHIKEIIKEKNLLNYGVENVFQSELIREKIKQTNLEKYNVEYPSQNKEIQEKMKETCLERYGVENPGQVDEFKNKMKESCLERYGVEHISQMQEFKEKCKETCLERYGVEHPSQTKEFIDKVKQTFIKNYGVDNPNKTPEIREKIRQTNLKRYNVEYPSQNKEIQEKIQKNAKKYKEYLMPSGEIRKVQGYEPFALDELVRIYEESDIITDRKDIPRITYKIEDKQKYYFPDIYIKSINKIIEVKSSWTYACKEDNIQEKAKATILKGYNYEVWIYDKKGVKLIKN
jgi:hypothetical protein